MAGPYDLHCPFCGTQTEGGRCPRCSPPAPRPPEGVGAGDRTSATVEVAPGRRPRGTTDRAGLYTAEGARRSVLARVALRTGVAAGVTLAVVVGLALLFLGGLGVAVAGGLADHHPALGVVVGLVWEAVVVVALVQLVAGLRVLWRHRDDYDRQRAAGGGRP